jgi:hypothetical protein
VKSPGWPERLERRIVAAGIAPARTWLEQTCRHEAAHALVGLRLGFPVLQALATDWIQGEVRCVSSAYAWRSVAAGPEDIAAFMVAGFVADLVAAVVGWPAGPRDRDGLPSTADARGSMDDASASVAVARLAGIHDADGVASFGDGAVGRAADLLFEPDNGAAWLTLTAALLTNGMLLGSEMRTLIGLPRYA